MRWQILIPLTSIVSSCMALSVIWWASQRRGEREAYYRYELSRLMLERYAGEAERVLAWLREEEANAARRRHDAIRMAAWVLLTGGAAVMIGLRLPTGEDSLFGWIPIGIGLGLFLFLVLSRSRDAPERS